MKSDGIYLDPCGIATTIDPKHQLLYKTRERMLYKNSLYMLIRDEMRQTNDQRKQELFPFLLRKRDEMQKAMEKHRVTYFNAKRIYTGIYFSELALEQTAMKVDLLREKYQGLLQRGERLKNAKSQLEEVEEEKEVIDKVNERILNCDCETQIAKCEWKDAAKIFFSYHDLVK